MRAGRHWPPAPYAAPCLLSRGHTFGRRALKSTRQRGNHLGSGLRLPPPPEPYCSCNRPDRRQELAYSALPVLGVVVFAVGFASVDKMALSSTPPVIHLLVLVPGNLNSAACRHPLLKRSCFSTCFQWSRDPCAFLPPACFNTSAVGLCKSTAALWAGQSVWGQEEH